ncbi:N-6 DNA methylase [Burkholderia cepacia]|uniref:N-6 DNA methylase n=1 Tax=Burkholderia cepacia TaxID=292 RepID=UPI001CF533A3|nr:N-6 DNA methylase [Burkholderia cepacia]MCA8135668.1 N-6 DNA methylase [Burkholderia cepacia]
MHSWAAAYQQASTTQKSLGAYATHNAFANALARITFSPLATDRIYRVVDPSVGAGNLLLAAFEQFGKSGTDSVRKKFLLSLHGMELDPRARELCCLLIWLAGLPLGIKLEQVAKNIRLGNALTYDWWGNQDLYDVLLMNPPWESLRQKVDVEQDPARERQATIERLSKPSLGNPALPSLYTAQGTGDRNLFKAFVELAPHLLDDGARLGALLPAAFASDAGLTGLRERYFNQFEIARWTSYENRAGYFPIDSRYKFGLLAATRSMAGTKQLSVRGFAVEPDEVDVPHIVLQRADIALIGRKYHIIPELSQQRELDILRIVLANGVPLFEAGALGRVVYRREIDLSLDKAHFKHISSIKLSKCGDGTFMDGKGKRYVPLLEGRSVGAYDCFQKTWVSGSGRTAVWQENADQPLSTCKPQYVTAPALGLPPRVAICDITAATNTRTVIATWVPGTWRCGNTAPALEFESYLAAFAGLGILNSMVFDWIARRLTSGLHLNKFILEGFVWPKLDSKSLETVAHAAWSICIARPRSGLTAEQMKQAPWAHETGKKVGKPKSVVHAAATIEHIVARSLGLTEEHLATIYDSDRSDRRGFWRYFDSETTARGVASKALELARKG